MHLAEADETKLMHAGQAWLAFSGAAEGNAELAVTAVEAMTAENTSQGITALAEYWDKVAGEGGYLANIQRELDNGEYVALDTSRLARRDFDDLKDLVASHPGWADQVVIY